jgi:hypothetical protein
MQEEINNHEQIESTSDNLFKLALVLSVICYSLVFYTTLLHYFGRADLNFKLFFEHPKAVSEFIFEAFAGSLLLPSLHVAIASFFKSKRNEQSRHRIFIGWTIFIICLQILTILVKK